ncbi:hypothetical protein BSK49_10700 [Paenibacillus odorifer]|uniref:hypothetical protein n=1 Tax=Paenibacillus TaxID=44249 RepID=UPI00096D3AE5|nr:hypothetical protein [Paenibacillus odorifer]OMD89831.1 hypothetical protein BSK49_10700 [Paenibacillus odorifer]
MNLYTYVHNNPLINIDPTGNYCESGNGRYAHTGGCTNSSSLFVPDTIKNNNPGRSITQLLDIYKKNLAEAVANAPKIDPHNYVVKGGAAVVPYPSAQAGKVNEALVKTIGITAAVSVGESVTEATSSNKKQQTIYHSGSMTNTNHTARPQDTKGLSAFLAPDTPK